MNRITLAGVVVIGTLVALTIIGGFWLHLNRPDATATFVSQSVQLIGLVTVAAGVFASLSKIQGQTNGTLSARDDRIKALEQEKAALSSELSSTRELHAAATGTVPASTALQTPAVIPPSPAVQPVQPDPQQPG